MAIKKSPDSYRGTFNLVSFCTSLPVWQAKILMQNSILWMEIQNDKTFILYRS